MKPSEHDGTHIDYIDGMKLHHSGVIVGQSNDGQWLYVRSDNPNVANAIWHFQVSKDILPALATAR